MERRLQSSLEKKTRVGWQTRVYRLERGYLSGWPDVSSVAANEEPSRVICLFQGNQVATLSDQGACPVQRRHVQLDVIPVVLACGLPCSIDTAVADSAPCVSRVVNQRASAYSLF